MDARQKKDVGELMFGHSPKSIRKICVGMFLAGIAILLLGFGLIYLDTTSSKPGGNGWMVVIGLFLAGGCTVVAPFLINARSRVGVLLARISAGFILLTAVVLAIFTLMRMDAKSGSISMMSIGPVILMGAGAVVLVKVMNSSTMLAFMDGESKESLDLKDKAREDAQKEQLAARIAAVKAKQDAAREAKKNKTDG